MDNRNEIDVKSADIEQGNGEYAVRRSRRANIVAIVVCLLLALLVWVLVMNAEDTERVSLALDVPEDSAYTYELSTDEIEIKGSVATLKDIEEIVVVPSEEMNKPDVYHVSIDNFKLPEGVTLAGMPELTIIVKEK